MCFESSGWAFWDRETFFARIFPSKHVHSKMNSLELQSQKILPFLVAVAVTGGGALSQHLAKAKDCLKLLVFFIMKPDKLGQRYLYHTQRQ